VVGIGVTIGYAISRWSSPQTVLGEGRHNRHGAHP